MTYSTSIEDLRQPAVRLQEIQAEIDGLNARKSEIYRDIKSSHGKASSDALKLALSRISQGPEKRAAKLDQDQHVQKIVDMLSAGQPDSDTQPVATAPASPKGSVPATEMPDGVASAQIVLPDPAPTKPTKTSRASTVKNEVEAVNIDNVEALLDDLDLGDDLEASGEEVEDEIVGDELCGDEIADLNLPDARREKMSADRW